MKNESEGEDLKVFRPGTGGAIKRSINAGPKLTALIKLTDTVCSLGGILTGMSVLFNMADEKAFVASRIFPLLEAHAKLPLVCQIA